LAADPLELLWSFAHILSSSNGVDNRINMAQSNVLELLKKKRKWISTKQLSEELGINASTVNCALRKMLKYSEIDKKEVRNGSYRHYEYKSK